MISVALLTEGVDRNKSKKYITQKGWQVVLLAEGVDRNDCPPDIDMATINVALLAEGVDRNRYTMMAEALQSSRPPRGGRG